MKSSISIVAAVAMLVVSGPAFAGTGTYTTKGDPPVTTGTPQRGGSMQTGTSVVTMSDGSTINEKWTCIGVTNPPNSKIFDVHTICDVSSDRGNYTATFGCQAMEGGMQGCVGGLYGRSGAYEGKTGATTWSGGQGSGSGTMQWRD